MGPWREDDGRERLEAHENDEDEDEETNEEREREEFEEEEEEEWSQNQVETRRLTQRASVAETSRKGLTGERTRMEGRTEQDWRRERAWHHACHSPGTDRGWAGPEALLCLATPRPGATIDCHYI